MAPEHARHGTLSTLSGAGERVQDLKVLMSVGAAVHLPPQCLPERALSHPGVPGGGAPVAGDTHDIHFL